MYAVDYNMPSKGSSSLVLSMLDPVPQRSVDILNTLMEVYMKKNIGDRNRIALSTIDFIDKRIDIVGRDLANDENTIEEFKQKMGIADMAAQSGLLVSANAATQQKLADLEVQLDVIGSISDYLQTADDKSIILPASLLENAGVAGLMTSYNEIQTKIENSLIVNTPDNPVTKSLIHQKNELKQNIIGSLSSSKNEMQLTVNKIKSELGIYFITGNHEEFGDNSKFISAVNSAGIKVLDNKLVSVDKMQVIGLDYNDSINRDDYEKIISGLNIDKNKPSILLKHEPSNLDIANAAGISLQISGHTHRAQMWPLEYIAKLVYKGYSYGLKNYLNMQVYISSGVGTWGPPMRVGTNSEIVFFTFSK